MNTYRITYTAVGKIKIKAEHENDAAYDFGSYTPEEIAEESMTFDVEIKEIEEI